MRVEGFGAISHIVQRNEGQHELSDQGPELRPSAADVLQEFSVYVSVS